MSIKSFGIQCTKNKILQIGIAGALAAVSLSATPLFGTLSLSSSGASTIAVSATMIDFGYVGGGVTDTPPPSHVLASALSLSDNGGHGDFTVTGASTGSFAPITGAAVQVQNLSAFTAPAGLPVSIANFVTFLPSEPSWSFTLTELLPGVFSDANCLTATGPGGVCTPTGSAFNLINSFGNQVQVSLSFLGIAVNDLGESSSVKGTFSTTLSGTNLADVNILIASGYAVVSSAGATMILEGVPEPGTTVMLLSGLGLMAGMVFFRRRRTNS